MIDSAILGSGEAAIFKLRALYKKYGFMPFKMSKFEEYDLYVRNKDFLQGNGVITFNDTDGELLALKPDVTLSIIKNTTEQTGCVRKVYYDENVYRISGDTHHFKEIMQTGIECIGNVDAYCIFEVLYLAAMSLGEISENFVIDISHMGILKALLDELTDDSSAKERLTALIAQKNRHELISLCDSCGISSDKLIALMGVRGSLCEAVAQLHSICKGQAAMEALSNLERIAALLEKTELAGKIRIDFSVVNNMSYYDGIVFKGFLLGIPDGVLAGGQYGALLKSMGRDADAIGFAIYLDKLEELSQSCIDKYDIDTLVLYSDETSLEQVASYVADAVNSGKSVSAQRSIPDKLRYRELADLRKEVEK